MPCLVCLKDYDVNLVDIRSEYLYHYKRIYIYEDEEANCIPLCSSCAEKIRMFNRKYDYPNPINSFLWALIPILPIIMFINLSIVWGFLIIIILGLTLMIGLDLYLIFLALTSSFHKYNPLKYIRFKRKKKYIRPGGKGKWIEYEDWLESIELK